MNRLKHSTCYLSGAMDRVSDHGTKWRDELKPFLRDLNINVIDPCDKPKSLIHDIQEEGVEYRTLRDKYKEEENYEELAKLMRKVRNIDLRFVDISSFIIVNIDLDVHLCGTYNEVAIAIQQKKPIIVRCEQGKKNCPFWLFGCIPHSMIFSTWDEVKTYITHIDKDKEIDDLGRWFLFDFDQGT